MLDQIPLQLVCSKTKLMQQKIQCPSLLQGVVLFFYYYRRVKHLKLVLLAAYYLTFLILLCYIEMCHNVIIATTATSTLFLYLYNIIYLFC